MDGADTFANPEVLAFYKTLPFNFRDSVESSAEAIREQNPLHAYPVLRPVLGSEVSVLDVGCGAGWFSNAISHHAGSAVTGIDFNPVAVARAKEVAANLGLSTRFEVADLFLYQPIESFDLVVSLGVLHHTDNCRAAVRHVCENFVRPGGHAFIGLYHKDGRQPFLDHFRAMKDRGESEKHMFERYKELHSQLHDDTLLRSWFRDQVLHPHETQHTLAEMVPIIEQAGMELVSTSINRFEPIGSLQSLFEEEKKLREIGLQRLQNNKYFTGFFVFLARKKGSDKRATVPSLGSSAISNGGHSTQVRDSKPYIEHDPKIGYRYLPNLKLLLPRPGGGRYSFETNSKGIRSAREYSFEKPPGVYRIIVCGDSMPAGQYVANDHRFTELLERLIPNTEVINLALEGSGTDQQLLLYENVGRKYEHDLVLLMPFLSNIRRNMLDARVGYDAKSGTKLLRGKPRFDLIGRQLVLRNVPVPRGDPVIGIEDTTFERTDAKQRWLQNLKEWISSIRGASSLKKLAYAVIPWEPFPEYRNARSPEWQLMEALIKRFKESAAWRPLVVVPTFYDSYVRYRMARNYWHRFQSLSSIPGIHVIDLLPHFRRLGKEAVRCFQIPYDMHFSQYGHLVVAEALQENLLRQNFFPTRRFERTDQSSFRALVCPSSDE